MKSTILTTLLIASSVAVMGQSKKDSAASYKRVEMWQDQKTGKLVQPPKATFVQAIIAIDSAGNIFLRNPLTLLWYKLKTEPYKP